MRCKLFLQGQHYFSSLYVCARYGLPHVRCGLFHVWHQELHTILSAYYGNTKHLTMCQESPTQSDVFWAMEHCVPISGIVLSYIVWEAAVWDMAIVCGHCSRTVHLHKCWVFIVTSHALFTTKCILLLGLGNCTLVHKTIRCTFPFDNICILNCFL